MATNKCRQEDFENHLSLLYNKIRDFSVRETKNSGIISLPEKIYHDVKIGYEIRQKEMYEQVRTEMQLLIQHGDITIMDESQDAIKRLLRLVQITSNPKLLDESYIEVSGKEILLDHVLRPILAQEEKVIVWSIFTSNIDYFARKFKKYNAVKITGKMNVEDRQKSVEAFKNGNAQILFATPQSAKEGLTLTVASNAVFYDRGFNLDDYLQAQDRIHRISQKKDCHIYNLMIEDSIDEWIDVLLKAKQRAAFLAQGDINLSTYKETIDYSFAEIVHQILNT